MTFTLAHMFGKAGDASGAFGKWGLGAPGSASEPLKMGFDRFYGFIDLSKDPGKKHNVAGEHSEVVMELDPLIKNARTVSPVENFNFPVNR